MIKAVFFDVDGTLLSHRTKSVPQSTRLALEMLRAKGIKTVIATGRNRLQYRILPVSDVSCDAYVMVNGQLCYDENWKLIFANEIKDKPVLDRLFTERKVPITYIEEDREYINFVNDDVMAALTSVSTKVQAVQEKPTANPVYQVVVYVEKEKEPKELSQLSQSRTIRWNTYGTDIISKDGGKLVGIRKYMEHEGLSADEIMCFGDGENDIEMIRFAKIGVAMGNALDMVKENADYVTDDVDSDGILNALKHFELI